MTEENDEAVEHQNAAQLEATDSVGKQLLGALVDEVRQMKKVWNDMPEHEQQPIINRLESRVRCEVIKAINVVAAAERPVLEATVEQVVFKGGVKATLTMVRGDKAAHDLADAEGSRVLIVVADPETYLNGMGDVKAEPDQKDLVDDQKDLVDEQSAADATEEKWKENPGGTE